MLNAVKKVVVLGCFLFLIFLLTRSSRLSYFLCLFLIWFPSSLFLKVFLKTYVWQRTMMGMCAPLCWAWGKQNCLLSSWSITVLMLNWFCLAIGLLFNFQCQRIEWWHLLKPTLILSLNHASWSGMIFEVGGFWPFIPQLVLWDW